VKSLILLIAVALCGFIPASVFADQPVFDSINYASPSQYLAVADSLGDGEAIAKLAKELKASASRKTLANVLGWIDSNLKYDDKLAYEWRNFDTIVSQRCYGGCADQAICCGALLQSAGIPTVWVKTMDVEWIWDFKKKRPFNAWAGHVFLEIFLDGKWVLLDPGASTIYTDYSPKSRILPGNRFAYHKGTDPKRMVMSLQWEDWKRQTALYFTELDESLLPVDAKSKENIRQRVFIIANSPYWQIFSECARKHGATLGNSFNAEYEKNLPRVCGNILLVETHDGVPIVDVAILQRYFPAVPNGRQTGKLIDNGTTIVFVELAMIADQIAAASEPSDTIE
jgi:hypothetical protein